MSHGIKWQPRARRELADVYLVARRRGLGRAVTQASAQVDVLLAQSPDSQGEARDDHNRVVFVWPLAVHFEVVPKRRRVIVQSVRFMPHQPS